MAQSRARTLVALLKPKVVRIGLVLFSVLAAYDTLANQLELPTARRWWGISGSLLPWWGWLLILQGIFVYALFDYVRRLPRSSGFDQDIGTREEFEAFAQQIVDNSATVGETMHSQSLINEAFRSELTSADEKLAEKLTWIVERIGSVDGDLRNLLNVVGDRLDKLAADVTKLAKLEAKADELTRTEIDAVNAELHRVKDYAEGSTEALKHVVAELQRTQSEIQKEHKSYKGIVEHALESTWEKVERRCEWIDQGFAAILDRERLSILADTIAAEGDELSGPTQGEPVGDWEAWLARFGSWHRNMETWARIAAIYRAGVVERVFDTPRSEYRGTWKASDDLFPNSIAVHDYKTFRIILRNFHAERSHVDSCVRMAAFVRPSMKGRGTAQRDQEQIPLPPAV
jgi:hypothetical protein